MPCAPALKQSFAALTTLGTPNALAFLSNATLFKLTDNAVCSVELDEGVIRGWTCIKDVQDSRVLEELVILSRVKGYTVLGIEGLYIDHELSRFKRHSPSMIVNHLPHLRL